MRVHLGPVEAPSTEHLAPDFDALAAGMQMDYNIRPTSRKTRVADHGVQDRLLRQRPAVPGWDGPAAHRDPSDRVEPPEFLSLAASYGVPFHHLPVI